MFRPNWIITFVAALALTVSGADLAIAKNKIKNKNNGAASANVKAGKKAVPPGQIKRYTRGAKLPGDVKYNSISDLSKWKMKPLGAGEKYIRVDNEILRVSDTMKVLAIVGLVSELAN
jgi:Ni/Co efflux regulator RcnB